MLTKRLSAIILLFFIASGAYTQGFQIRTVNEGFGKIGIQVRDTTDVPVSRTNFITDIVFGIKWKGNYNVDLDKSSISTNYNIKVSGSRAVKDSFYFQAFYADNTPYQLPEDWTQNTWIEIMSVSNTLTASDTGTFQICETNFDATTNPNIGIDLIDFTPSISGEANGVVLPVKLLDFTAVPDNNTVKLKWTTTSEVNSKGFEIQRSEDDANNFTTIGYVNSKNNSQKNSYDFTDDKATGGMRYYYRLKQIDINGRYQYSAIRDAILDKFKSALVQLSPNPAKDLINLYFSPDCIEQSVSIKIVDSKGSIISVKKETIAAGKKLQYNISSFAGGQYFILIENEEKAIFKTGFQKM